MSRTPALDSIARDVTIAESKRAAEQRHEAALEKSDEAQEKYKRGKITWEQRQRFLEELQEAASHLAKVQSW